MGSIVRPTKVGGGTNVLAGNDVLASEWNGDMNTIYTDYNGNIDAANLKDKAVTDAKLANDTSSDAARAVGVNHVKNDTVIARTVKKTVFTKTDIPNGISSNSAHEADTGISTTGNIPISFYWEITGAPGHESLTIVSFKFSTATNTWWVRFANTANGISLDLNGKTFKAIFLAAS